MLSDKEICARLLPFFADYFGDELCESFSPEDSSATPPDERIDLVAHFGTNMLALEHTRVAPFNDFERVNANTKHAEEQIRPLIDFLGENEFLGIGLPRNWESLLAGRQKRVFFGQVRTAAERNIVKLRDMDHFRKYQVQSSVEISGIQMSFFHRYSETLTGVGISLMFESDKLERHRQDRIKSKLPSKVEKLERWKSRGYRSVLVLEDRDIQLSDEAVVAEAVNSLLSGHTHEPDFVVYIDVGLNIMATALPIKTPHGWDWNLWTVHDKPRFFEI